METKKTTTGNKKTNLVVNKVDLLKQVKKETTKKPKVKKVSFHNSLLNVNRLDKQENFSLSGAIRRFEKQLKNDSQYITIDVNVISKGLEFETILKYINQKCIDKQKFTVYSVGLAFNKFLKVTL
jgi:hypothetical protein